MDNGGSTAIPYGATERGTVYRECIRCGMACNSVSLRGMLCLMCRLVRVLDEPDDDLVPLSPTGGEALAVGTAVNSTRNEGPDVLNSV